jgi:hypothetical protein
VLEVLEESLENVTKNLSKKSVMENYQRVTMIIDEIVDEGVVINTDAESIEAKIFLRESSIKMENVTATASSAVNSASGYFKSVRMC